MWKSQRFDAQKCPGTEDTLINVHNGSKDQSKSILLIIIRPIIMYFPFSACTGCQRSIGKVELCMQNASTTILSFV